MNEKSNYKKYYKDVHVGTCIVNIYSSYGTAQIGFNEMEFQVNCVILKHCGRDEVF